MKKFFKRCVPFIACIYPIAIQSLYETFKDSRIITTDRGDVTVGFGLTVAMFSGALIILSVSAFFGDKE